LVEIAPNALRLRLQPFREFAESARSIAALKDGSCSSHNGRWWTSHQTNSVPAKYGEPVASSSWEEFKTAAPSLGLEAQLLDVRKSEDIVQAFDTAIAQRADAILVANDTVTLANRGQVVELAAKHWLPAMYNSKSSSLCEAASAAWWSDARDKVANGRLGRAVVAGGQ
jgi:hypothetical protein